MKYCINSTPADQMKLQLKYDELFSTDAVVCHTTQVKQGNVNIMVMAYRYKGEVTPMKRSSQSVRERRLSDLV